ncbi:MAG: hypothetical protein LJE93_11575 [Acidobacteria bacterium]|jgi:hypothetical protein|nr:hypothetical protein [Acidobacteriota bacterium]
MLRTVQSLALVLLIAGTAAAVDVTLRDGTVITAESYRLTGSYIMLKLADGRQVAYDVADVDLDALRAAEAAAAGPAAEGAGAAEASTGTLSGGRTLKDTATLSEKEGSSLTISDRDVRHVKGSGVVGDEEETGETAASGGGVPEGFQQGGGVVLNSIRVTPAGEGQWSVEGEVINRTSTPVQNVRVQLEAAVGGTEEPWRGQVAVTNYLGPDETGVFAHSFAGEAPAGRAHPDVRASVIWMSQETTRTPDYTGAGGVPHPSNLPLEHGGVTGVEVRPTPVE